MKKILSIIITVILLASCFAVTCFADMAVSYDYDFSLYEKTVASLSEDLSVLTVNGETFTQTDLSKIDMYYGKLLVQLDGEKLPEEAFFYSDEFPFEFNLSEAQKEYISAVSAKVNESLTVCVIDLHYKNGSTLSQTFIKDSLVPEFEKLLKGEGKYEVDFWYPEDNTVITEKDKLYVGEATEIDTYYDFEYTYGYEVRLCTNNGEIGVSVGAIILGDDTFYYVENAENGKSGTWYDDVSFTAMKLKAYKITDAELLEELNQAQRAYIEDDYGFLYDGAGTEMVGNVLLILFFVIAPLAVLVIFTIKAIKGKGAYRKFYIAISVGALVELIIFAITALMLK